MHARPAQFTTVTRFRKYLSIYIDHVRYGDHFVCIERKGCDPVYLISQADFDLMCKRSDELLRPPINPQTGTVTKGNGFWCDLLELLSTERKRRG